MAGQLPQGLVRPLGVVDMPEAVERPLLPPGVGPWRGRGLRLKGAMQPLEAAVLFGTAWLYALGHNPQLDPPYGQRREAAQANAREWRSIVAAYHPGQTVLPECAFERAPCLRASRTFQPVAYEQVPRRGTCAVMGSMRAVDRAEPALEVDGPHVVGLTASEKGSLHGALRRLRRRHFTSPARSTTRPCLELARACQARCVEAGATPHNLLLHLRQAQVQ